MPENKEVAVSAQSMGERFQLKIINEFGSGVGEIALTKFQKRLAQNYFMKIDSVLQAAEQKRNKGKEPVPVIWQNVNMESLARNVVAAARIGLDPMERNHINPIPYKNNNTGKYDITFILGYSGIELKAKKYGLEVPIVTVELVHANDRFKSIKKDRNNKIESFEFEVVNDFDRGAIVGGFYYHDFTDHPEKNKLVVMTLKDILKRKPKYASPEFWGGEKDIWQNGKKTGEKEQVEGWYEAMVYKTVYRAAYNAITIDSQKIDDDYMRLSQAESDAGRGEFDAEYRELANSTPLITEGGDEEHGPVKSGEVIDEQTGEIIPEETGVTGDAPPFAVAG